MRSLSNLALHSICNFSLRFFQRSPSFCLSLLLLFFNLLKSFFILCNCVLSQILIKHLIVKLVRVLIDYVIVQATSMWLNDVTLFWPWNICKGVISFLDAFFHSFLMVESSVLVLNKSSHRRLMSLCSFLVILTQCNIKPFFVLGSSSLIQLP